MNIKFYIVIFSLIISVIIMIGIIFLTYNDKEIINDIIDEKQDNDKTKKKQIRFCNKIFNVTYLYLLLGLIIVPIIIINMLET
jgi:Na+/H+ antiporter NhaD/arsenite permease-like protein